MEALRLLKNPREDLDLVLLEVDLPDISGLVVLERFRMGGNRTPVIFLTARNAVEDRVAGLRLGADDYVGKPFEFPELLARIAAILRRYASSAPLCVGPLRIDVVRQNVHCGRVRIEMSPREFTLLRTLARSRGRPISRSELLKDIWGIDFDPDTNVLAVTVRRLRERIDPWAPGLIRTVVGLGYVIER